jgi:hypothetical protein
LYIEAHCITTYKNVAKFTIFIFQKLTYTNRMNKPTFEERVLSELGSISKALADIERKVTILEGDVEETHQNTTRQSLDTIILKSAQRELLGRLRTVEDASTKSEQSSKEIAHATHGLGALQEKIDQIIKAVRPESGSVSEHKLRLVSVEKTL